MVVFALAFVLSLSYLSVEMPARYPPATKAKAWRLYADTSMTNHQIADECGVCYTTIVGWIKAHKWPQKKRQLYQDMIRNSETEYAMWASRERIAEAKRQLNVAKDYEDALRDKVKPDPGSGERPDVGMLDLARGARALKDATAVSARATGLFDKKDGDGPGRGQPLIIVGLQAHRAEPPALPDEADDALEAEFTEVDPEAARAKRRLEEAPF